ncbi:MAG TPA: M20/M25/M40 family metallo-hydrolase [Anaerolineales bacterium]|nr:M20/M25/M40 family metallo-hydrolase [Anaerolineales bacterium]
MTTNFIHRLLDAAVQIQQIAAPTFEEKPRAEFVRDLFAKEKLKDVSMDSVDNVYARLPGAGQAGPLIVSAHLDTVFPSETSLHVTRDDERVYGPGIGDNSLGVAALFGLIWMLRERRIKLRNDVWFVANVCEEGLGDLRGMKAVVDRFNENAKAYLVIEGMSFGHVYHRAIGVRRYRVMAKTAGGHSWSDYGQPSAVHEAAKLVTKIAELSVPAVPRTTLNVGKISGGTGINVLASAATFELDLRSESTEALNALVHQVEELIRSANKEGVAMASEVIGARPAGEIAPDHPLIKLAEECLLEQGIKAELTSGSTDANIPLSRGLSATVLGVTTGGGAHTVHEFIDVGPVEKGMEQLVRFVSRI